jgi:hypothetical protein
MSNADAPKTLKTLKLATPRRAWILGQRLYLGKYMADDAGVEVFQSFRADRANLMLYSGIQFPLALQRFSNRFQRFTGLISTLASDESVIEIFPELTISFQVNQDSGFLTRRVCDKLNAF